jgi:hypothetical protein
MITVERDMIEIDFKNKYDKNLAMLVLRRYINELKGNEGGDNVTSKELSISFNKKCRINKPILKLTDFYDKDNRMIRNNKDFKVK